MAICKTCGQDAGETKYCPYCGVPQEEESTNPVTGDAYASDSKEETFTETFLEDELTNDTNHAIPSEKSFSNDTNPEPAPAEQIITPVNESFTNPKISPDFTSYPQEPRPSNTGQVVFSVINIILGIAFCCGLASIISLLLGIVALVMSVRASNSPSSSDAYASLKTAKVLNIIGIAMLGISIFVLVRIITETINEFGGFEGYMEAVQRMMESGEFRT